MAAKKEKSKQELLQKLKFSKLQAKGMPKDIKQLQEELRDAQLKISLLEAMIDISDEQFGTNIRKKAGTRQS